MDPISFNWEDPSCSWLPELKSHHLDVILEPGTTVLQLPSTGIQGTCKLCSGLMTTKYWNKACHLSFAKIFKTFERPWLLWRLGERANPTQVHQVQVLVFMSGANRWANIHRQKTRGKGCARLLCNCLREVLYHSFRLAFINCDPQVIYLDALPDHLQSRFGFCGTAP